METGAITGYIDVAQVALYVFWIFFAGLIFYLRREDRREGYPLERDNGSKEDLGVIWFDKPKRFTLPHGRGTADSGKVDSREIKLKKIYAWEGSPFEPTGDPMADGVGPASYAEREDEPDLTLDGKPKIVPLRAEPDYYPCDGDDDPRGMTVFGADGKAAGTVTELWIDKADLIARYMEVTLAGREQAGGAQTGGEQPGEPGEEGTGQTAAKGDTVLVPREFTRVRGPNAFFNKLLGLAPRQPGVYVEALRADQFANVPRIKGSDRITAMEEERVAAYFGGGKLFATKQHEGPVL